MSDERVRALLREIERELAGTGRTVLDVILAPKEARSALSVRAINVLSRVNGVKFGPGPVADTVAAIEWDDIARCPGFGVKTRREIVLWLREHGLKPHPSWEVWGPLPMCRVEGCRGDPLQRLHGVCVKHGASGP